MKADGFGIGQMLTLTYCFGVSLQSGPNTARDWFGVIGAEHFLEESRLKPN